MLLYQRACERLNVIVIRAFIPPLDYRVRHVKNFDIAAFAINQKHSANVTNGQLKACQRPAPNEVPSLG